LPLSSYTALHPKDKTLALFEILTAVLLKNCRLGCVVGPVIPSVAKDRNAFSCRTLLDPEGEASTSVQNAGKYWSSDKVLRPRPGAQPEFFFGGVGADPQAIYNLCLILKIMLQK
jgi:hypothetical protein